MTKKIPKIKTTCNICGKEIPSNPALLVCDKCLGKNYRKCQECPDNDGSDICGIDACHIPLSGECIVDIDENGIIWKQ